MWLFVLNLGIAFGAGIYESRIEFPHWLSHLLASSGMDTRRLSRTIGSLRTHFNEPLKIEETAREPGMSVSGFHHHFKSVTMMSPLQFQEQIRLQEARRLMLGEDLYAASAGFRVGYANP
jgi:AraC-like DNA-binding protein